MHLERFMFVVCAGHSSTAPQYAVSTTAEAIGNILSVGIISGLGINVSHELVHKAPFFEQLLGRICLTFTCYGHFYVEHLLGHHKRVSTPHDPATSRRGESVYSFYLRCVPESLQSAIHLEAARLQKRGKSPWSPDNAVLQSFVLSALWAVLAFRFCGFAGLKFFLLQSWIGFTLLEVINYVEHYGLMRDATGPDTYTRVTPMHSWNAGHRITNYFLFKLQRHSDHHAFAWRRYQVRHPLPRQCPWMMRVMMLVQRCC
jgi:alkane 1-monooxygenase